MKEQTNLYLDKKTKETSMEKIKSVGGKLSGLVENLLEKFNKGEITI